MTILFRGATLADWAGERSSDLLVKDGLIAGIAGAGEFGEEKADRVVDAKGLLLMPSFVDLHAHFRDPGQPHKEDMESGSRAAVHGGYTAVNLMPNTKPVCSDMETVRYVRERAEAVGLCDVNQTVSITAGFDGKSLAHLEGLDPADTHWLTDDGNGVEPSSVILAAMELAAKRGFGVMLHEEDRTLTLWDSYLAEELPTLRDVRLAELTGCRTHFCHVSTKKAMEYILEGRRRGAPVTWEACPHHIALTDQVPGHVAPPLRGEEHRRALIEAVRAGLCDAISTDHAPHTPEDKAAGMNGFTGLDLSFSTCYTVLVREEGIPLAELSRLMSRSPAGILGIPGGTLGAGEPANLVLIDPEAKFRVEERHIHSKSKNTPMLGRELWGEVLMTVKGGRVVYEKAAD